MNVYLFMGTHLPELRTCTALLAESVEGGRKASIFWPETQAWPEDCNGLEHVEKYKPDDVAWVFDPDSEDSAFIVLDPASDLIGQLEKVAEDLSKCLIEPVKVVTAVDCEAAEKSPQLRAWLDACIYYSDIVLLGNRQNASKSYVRDFQKSYEKKCYPSLFIFLNGAGSPKEPLEILTPDTRRLSQMFDLPEEEVESLPGLIIEASCDLEVEEEEMDPYRIPESESGELMATVPNVREHIVP